MLSSLWQVMLLDAAIGLGLISLAYWPRRRWGVFAVALLTCPFLICTRATTGLVMLSLCLGMWATAWRIVPGWVTIGVNLFLLAFVLPINFSILELEEKRLEGWRAEYPAASLEARLAYEEKRPHDDPQQVEPGAWLGEPETTMVLNDSNRARILKELHASVYDHFVISPGFGAARMRHGRVTMLQIPSADAVQLPEPRPEPSAYPEDREGRPDLSSPSSESPLQSGHPRSHSASDSPFDGPPGMLDFHRQAKSAFLDPEVWGYVRSRREVFGFEPHAIRQHTDFSWKSRYNNDRVWWLSRLELVSLLRHAPPRIYVSRRLPNMEQRDDIPTRELDRFEAAALPRLQGGEPIVIHSATNTTRMLGAIVAGKVCLQCHSVAEGFLLGAFSYQIDRRTPLPEHPPETLPAR